MEMDLELTPEQVNQIVREARVLAPGLTKEQFQWLVESQRRLADSGFCEAAWGLARLEQERGVTCAQTIDVLDDLLTEKAQVEAALAQLEQKHLAQQAANQEAAQRHKQLIEAIVQAKADLAEMKSQQASAEKELTAFREKTERERKHIGEELEGCRQKARVTEQEVATAGQLKAEAERCGFSLALMLSLSGELAKHQDAREKLAGALQKHQNLTEYVTAMEKEAAQIKAVRKTELNNLGSQIHQAKVEIQSLEDSRRYLGTVIAQLQADMITEEEMRRFYRRYLGVSGLMEFLATWDQIVFLRCNNALSAMAGVVNPSALAYFWTDRIPVVCPHCGQSTFIFDQRIYKALDWQLGVPRKLQLGE